MKKSQLNLIILIASLLLVSCSSTSKLGKTKVVEESGSKPNWVKSDQDAFEEKEKLFFRGIITNRKDLAYAKREAKAEAVKNVAEMINIRVRTEFSEATQGSNVSEQGMSIFTSDVVSWIVDNLNIQGISPSKQYWQRVEKTTDLGFKYFYNVHVLCEIEKADYAKARDLAIKKILQKYTESSQKQVREAAEIVKDRVLKD